jgi:hypothetical protein
MRNDAQNAIQCAQFEALLTDALDGVLARSMVGPFEQHRADCPNCAVMFAEAKAGMELLRGLDEAYPRTNLEHNILVATLGWLPAVQAEAKARPKPETEPGWLKKIFAPVMPVLRPVLQPRFALSAAMAFCSISVALTASGVKLNRLTAASFSPTAIRNGLVQTYSGVSARVERYWYNLRFVYEVESRVRELKNASPQQQQDEDQQQQQQNDQQKKDDRKNQKPPDGADKENKPQRQYAERGRHVMDAKLMLPINLFSNDRRAE